MNLIPQNIADIYASQFDNIHDTFSQVIQIVKSVKKPNSTTISDNDDDYNLVYDREEKIQNEFEFDLITTEITARVKYIDKQDKDFEFAITRSEGVNLTQEFGVIRIKVHIDYCNLVNDATRVIVDGYNTNVLFHDKHHGIVDFKFCTFYLQRTP